MLPVPYFHVVFTVPAQVAEIAFHNKEVVYGILFRASAEALRNVAAESRYLGAELGAITVLHTWGQALHHHPLISCRRSQLQNSAAQMPEFSTEGAPRAEIGVI